MNIKADYDVVIIGGGIHGAGVAQASVAQGYSVLLLEQHEIASGTSQKSSKLIHGGLRYLETAQFSLVRECLSERGYLLKNAPHLVEMKPFYLPVYKKTTRRPLQLRLGLSVYALLAGLGKQSFFHHLKKESWHQLDGLATRDLEAVFQYWDAQTDDKLLTDAVLNSARDMGADVVEQAKLESAVKASASKSQKNKSKETIEDVSDEWQITFQKESTFVQVSSKIIVNAGGPWVNDILKRIIPEDAGMAVDLVQGTHIVLPEETLQGIYYVESPRDKRAIFVMPWYGQTLVGTTEKLYTGDPAKVVPTIEEQAYLQEAAASYFPKFKETSIQGSFAGLRVLPRQQGTAFSRPRETTIRADKTHTCLSVYGGKLTAYRATSENVIKKIMRQLPAKKVIADTRHLKLPG